MVPHGKRTAFAYVGASLLLGALPFVASPAGAQCSPDPPTSGATVTCTGNPSGFTTTGLSTLTVDVLVGTNFNGPFSASVMNQLTVTTAGNMQTMTFSAIDVLTLVTSGNVNNGITISGFSTLSLTNSGNINNTLSITGTGNLSFTTSGSINSGITVSGAGSHSFTNSGHINTIFSLSGGGSDSVQNSGTINPGIQKSGSGTLSVTNAASGTINQGIFVTGSAQTTIDNFGTIQSAITLDTGNDQITNNGTLNGDSTMGEGDNTFLMQGGRLNGNVIQGSGTDSVVLSGGEITGAVRTGAGNDTLLWTGGLVGSIDMGAGNDRATLQGLTTTNLRGITIDGGQGSDVLVLNGTVGDQPQRLLNWEAIQLTQGSRLTMNGNLTLGDSATGSGILTIDSSSRLLVGEQGIRTIVPFTAGQLTTVINGGVIDLTNGGTSTSDRLGVVGNYVGQGGRLHLNTVLGPDGSPSDRLVVVGGVMAGNTTIAIANVGGQGAQTMGNGIRVVTAASGATSTATAFSLSGRVAAGAYEYQLFRGGFTRGTGNNWYLRNTISPIPPVPPDPAPTPTPTPTPTPPPSPGGGGDTGSAEDAADAADAASIGITGGIPLYRPEVALHAVMPSVARQAVRATLGTFHDREGETAFASGDGAFKAGWARLFGGSYKQSWSGDVSPAFNGTVLGVQVGLPLLALEHGSGEKDRAGLFFGYASASGGVTGFALGQQGMPVGNVNISAYSVGAYWTHFWPAGGYLDAVLMLSWLTGSTLSSLNVATNAHGRMGTASLELGYPIPFAGTWAIEPQAQGILQRWNGDATQDTFSNVSNAEDDIVTARFGLRLTNTIVADKMTIKPFAQVNLWQNFGGRDTITFGSTTIATNLWATALEFSGGVSASLGSWADLYAKVSYTTGIDANSQSALSGRLGFRVLW
jgi:outer membrane autotransporter protein